MTAYICMMCLLVLLLLLTAGHKGRTMTPGPWHWQTHAARGLTHSQWVPAGSAERSASQLHHGREAGRTAGCTGSRLWTTDPPPCHSCPAQHTHTLSSGVHIALGFLSLLCWA